MIKLSIRNKLAYKSQMRLKRKLRGRSALTTDGTATVPRVCVFKSNKYLYAQVVDDENDKVMFSVSSIQKELKDPTKSNKNKDAAVKVGEALAKKIKEQGIEKIKFDRNGFPYKGKIKLLADTARKAGLQF